jgi:uncharacterized RDD family membrane protein YckC
MNCSVCNRNNAVTLSICPSCGAMINDSVRQELVGKISVAAAKPFDFQLKGNKMTPDKTAVPAKPAIPQQADAPPKTTTAELAAKPAASTLVEFHSKNAAVPEWRLQLQNVVRQRQEREVAADEETATAPPRAQLITSGATALKAEAISEPKTFQHQNSTLNSALERIEKSRRQFLDEEKPSSAPVAPPVKANKNYPFHIAAKTNGAISKPADTNSSSAVANNFAKPKLASSLRAEKDKLDTNKLPPLPKIEPLATSFESRPIISDDAKPLSDAAPKVEIKPIETALSEIKHDKKVEVLEETETEVEEFVEEFDDCAPFAMRFNAGLFDLIIGSFASLLLLSPFMILGGSWFSVAGVFAFLATCAVVMFVYLTISVGLYGKTFGMRLFSLETIDIENEDYPTFHQAAVSSAVYLLSLALGGIGFLSLPFNEDKRAVHDLVSGTIIVKE